MASHERSVLRTPKETRSEIGLQYAALGEFADICKDSIDGVFIVPSVTVPYKWHGTLALIGGLYDGGFYQFELSFSLNGSNCPRMIFRPPAFHPLVDPSNGEFDFSLRFPGWQKENRIRDILAYLKEEFTEPTMNGRKNLEAALLLEQSHADYKARVRLNIRDVMQELSSEVNNSTSSELSFGPCIPELLEPQLRQILDVGDKIISKKQLPRTW